MLSVVEPVACKICGGNSPYKFTRDVTRADLKRAANVHVCEDCGYLFTTAWDMASEETMNKLYAYPKYLEFDIGARSQRRIHRAHGLVHYLIKKFKMENPRILMHGNGSCLSPHWLRQEGLDVWTSFDHLSDWDRRVVRGMLLDGSDAKFDLIVCTEVAEHFVYPLKDFGDAIKMLKKGGVFAGSTCFFDGQKATLDAIRDDKFHYTHDYHWNGGLAGMHTLAGMEKIAEHHECSNFTERGSDDLRKISLMPATSYFFQLQKP